MRKIWFIHFQDQVTGPFAIDEVTMEFSRISAEKAAVWCKSLKEWVPAKSWSPEWADEVLNAIHAAENQVWFFQHREQTHGPYEFAQIIEVLKDFWNLRHEIQVRSSYDNKWAELYKTPQILEPLGVSLRKAQRAPLRGSIKFTLGPTEAHLLATEPLLAQPASISTGGLGMHIVECEQRIYRGQNIKLEIKSHDLNQSVYAQGKVAYRTQDDYVGVIFDKLHAESQTTILDYIHQFETDRPMVNKAAA